MCHCLLGSFKPLSRAAQLSDKYRNLRVNVGLMRILCACLVISCPLIGIAGEGVIELERNRGYDSVGLVVAFAHAFAYAVFH